MKVRYLPQPEWGVGHLAALHDGGLRAEIHFPTREEPTLVSTKGGALVGHALGSGERVRDHKGRTAVVVSEEPGGRGLRRYAIRYDDGEEDELPESHVFALPPKPDMLSLLREGRVGDARNFLLRRQALRLDDERRCDALGALFASRVMVKPHQVGVVQRVLAARRPRFILADEVGLGKTIEAGMAFSALRLAGLANRVLVVTPSHLTVQWLAELFHKFNQLFTLMDGERFGQSLKEQPEVSPWARFDKVVTSLELLSRGEEHRAQAGAEGAFWDLVIIDEAHHLKGEKAFAAARALAKNSWGLLLLTATPMQLDPAEYQGLLSLIDPDTAPSPKDFESRLARQEELSTAVRALLGVEGSGEARAGAVAALARRFPDDERLRALEDPQALLAHLADTYSLSDRLLRNRRAVVGGFSERRLHRHRFPVPDAEQAARAQVLEKLREAGGLRGAPLASLLRRLESSSAAFEEAVRNSQALSGLSLPQLPAKDAKLRAFLEVLEGVWAEEPAAKVLVFTESRATLELLREQLLREGQEALGYHGELPLLERDRQVARFRDPDGPKLLICTEVGGEGRNFQFAHHLVHYDLPWSPATVEQRIGRLDRIGQLRPVEVHVLEPAGTLLAEVAELFASAVGVFGETVGGLDAVLEEVEPRLSELALAEPGERARYAKALQAKVAEARAAVKRAYDPLLDLRSFDRPGVESLVARAHERMGVELDEEGSLEEGLLSVARDLDERLEEATTELARKVGIGVDTDEQVEAFQCAFQFGHALNVEALPGLSIAEDRTVLGTFWRDTATEQEEIEYFATGHPIVEALFGFLKDGPFGRSGARRVASKSHKGRGIEFLFHAIPSEPVDTSPGARVPSRQLARFLDRWLIPVVVAEGPGGKPVLEPGWRSALEKEGAPIKGDVLRSAFPTLAGFVDGAAQVAGKGAEEALAVMAARAAEGIVKEREASLGRLALALKHQEVPEAEARAQVAAEMAHYGALLEALQKVKVVLDSACVFAFER